MYRSVSLCKVLLIDLQISARYAGTAAVVVRSVHISSSSCETQVAATATLE